MFTKNVKNYIRTAIDFRFELRLISSQAPELNYFNNPSKGVTKDR